MNTLVYFLPAVVLSSQYPFDTFVDGILDGSHDLSDPTTFAQFKSEATSQFPSPTSQRLFTNPSSLSEWITAVLTATSTFQDLPGLYESQRLCKYVKLGRTDDVHIGNGNAAINLEILKNLGIKAPITLVDACNDDICKIILDHQSLLGAADKCKKSSIQLKELGLTVGDGTLISEVDMSAKEMEGGRSERTTCFLSQMIDEADKHNDFVTGGLDVKKYSLKLRQASTIHRYFNTLSQDDQRFIKFEAMVIQLLRNLAVKDHLFLNIGYVKHAMGMSIEKVDEKNHFEILVFNSGGGLEYHQVLKIGSKIKYIPVMRFSNVPLLRIKTSGLLRQVLEGKAPLEVNSDLRYQAIHLYTSTLQSLSVYHQPFTIEEIKVAWLIPTQRSGTCSVRAILAYLAWHLREKFRPFKLALFKRIITLGAAKQWEPAEKVMAYRVLKFAFENHARSITKLMSSENTKHIYNYDTFGAESFWKPYKDISQKFILNPDAKFTLKPSSSNEPLYKDKLDKLKVVRERVEAELKRREEDFKKVTGDNTKNTEVDCRNEIEQLGEIITPQSFRKIVKTSVSVVSKFWNHLDANTNLAWLLSFGLYNWPSVSLTKDDIWNEIVQSEENLIAIV